MPQGPTIFTDGLLDASVNHGVVRLTLGRLGADNKALPAGLVVLPLTQLPALSQGLAKVMQQVEARMKEAAAQASDAAPAVPDSFNFGGR